jgi:hypothetical protein
MDDGLSPIADPEERQRLRALGKQVVIVSALASMGITGLLLSV